jgi:hypothetical protein
LDIHSLPQERLEGRLLSLALSGTEGGREAYLSVVKPEMFTGPRRNWHQAVVAGAVDLVWAQKWLLQNRKGLDGLDTIVGELGSTRPEQDAQLLMEAWAKREGQRILTEAQEWISVDPSVGLGRLASEAQKTIELASPVSLSGWSDAVASALDEAEKAARGEFEPRTIKGPCFDCDDADGFDCVCRFFPDSDLACPCHGSIRDTKPNPKLDPETRPNVPPRMM